MIWQNPWAWLGLASVALPVLIHLLGRGEARRYLFPSLRFLPQSRSLPVHRRRVRDPLLLAVRAGILAAATMALAQPLLLTRARVGESERGIARAIIVDTSASMRRRTGASESGVAAARQEAQRIASDAEASIVMESASPARALAGAAAWIRQQPLRGELVVVSDFQAGTLDERDLATIPRAVGTRLVRIPVLPVTEDVITRTADSPSRPNIVMLAVPAERSDVQAAERAADAVETRAPFDTARAVAIVYSSYEHRSELLATSTALRIPWMADLVARIRADSMLAVVAAFAAHTIAATDTNGALVVSRAEDGRPLVMAREGKLDGRDRLLLVPFANAGSLTSAALIAATTRALSMPLPVTELEQSFIADNLLATWQRAPAARVARTADARSGSSDGRWFWVLALALLAVETVLRRARPQSTVTAIQHDRAA
jgi:hypothetical protein